MTLCADCGCELTEHHKLHCEDATLQLLAFPFADHPDYDPSWRPAEVTA